MPIVLILFWILMGIYALILLIGAANDHQPLEVIAGGLLMGLILFVPLRGLTDCFIPNPTEYKTLAIPNNKIQFTYTSSQGYIFIDDYEVKRSKWEVEKIQEMFNKGELSFNYYEWYPNPYKAIDTDQGSYKIYKDKELILESNFALTEPKLK
jgi:hypothetical protein